MKHCLIVLVCLLFPLSLMCKETRETGQNADKRYEEIVKSVKDNPGQALADLKKLADKNRFAAMEYLILLSIYEPQKVNTPEFEQIARRLHTDVVAQYKKLVPDSPFYGIYQGQYEGLIKDDYLKCYKDLSCLIEIGALNFSKFFSVWGDVSGDMLYVPWKIAVPCPTAQKLHLTAVWTAPAADTAPKRWIFPTVASIRNTIFPMMLKSIGIIFSGNWNWIIPVRYAMCIWPKMYIRI